MTAPEGLAVLCDAQGRLRQVMCDTIEFARPPAVGESLGSILSHDNTEKLTALFHHIAEHGTVFDWSLNVDTPDGVRTARFAGAKEEAGIVVIAALSEEGVGQIVEHLVSMNSDLVNTVRELRQRVALDAMRASTAIRAAEVAFRASFEQSAVGMAHIGIDGTWIRVNQRLCDMLGYTREELSRLSFAELTHPDDVQESLEHLRRMLDGQETEWKVDKRYIRKDKSILWGRLSTVLVRDEKGQPDFFVTIVEDTSEQHWAMTALEASQLRFASAFRLSPDAVNINRLSDGLYLDVNEGFTSLTGYTAEEVVEKTSADIAIWNDPADRARLIEGLRAQGTVRNLEAQFRRKDGGLTTALMSAQVIDMDGIQCILSVTRDISERKIAEEELERRQSQLAELLDEREHNLAMLTHSLDSIIEVVSQVVETRDPYTAGHQRRVSELATRIAQELEMSGEQVVEIRTAALIHDVGKMSVPAEILSKPGALSPLEFELIKGHAEASYRILASAQIGSSVADIVHQHHERCDGSGYPQGLTADELLPGAKVLMVADVVEAMFSHRPYRAALGSDAALAEIERGRGTIFDERACDACVRVFREGGFVFSEA